MNGELIVERYPCLILYINTHSSIVNTHTNITTFHTHFVTRNNSIFSISQIKHGRPGPSNRPFLPGLSLKGKFVHTTTPCIPDDTSYQSYCAVSTQRCLRPVPARAVQYIDCMNVFTLDVTFSRPEIPVIREIHPHFC